MKWDSKGNPIKDNAIEKAKKKPAKLDVMKILKGEASDLVLGGVMGAVATGLGFAIVAAVPPLRKWATITVGADGKPQGEAKRAAVVTGTSLAVAGVGLMVASKTAITPKRAIELAPFVLLGTALVSASPLVVAVIVNRVDGFFSGMLSSTPAGYAKRVHGVDVGGDLSPGGALGARRRRRALTPDEILDGAPAGYAGRAHGVDFGGDLPPDGTY